MKPDWNDAPEWANWLAMDADGSWYWFEDEPLMRWHTWGSSGNYKLAEQSTWKDSKEFKPCKS